MAKAEKRIVYKAGITRSPSDFLCGDGELAECINLTTDNEELKVVMQPEEFMTGLTGTQKLIAVHKFSGDERFIISDSDSIKWGTKNDNGEFVTAKDDQEQDIVLFTASGTATAQVIGKFLIFSDEAGLHYFLWGDGLYKDFGNAIPEPEMEFVIVDGAWGETSASHNKYIESLKAGGVITVTTQRGSGGVDELVVVPSDGKQEEYNSLMTGLYSKCLTEIRRIKCFSRPFAVCFALELYNGKYLYISNPVMLFPSVSKNCIGIYNNTNDYASVEVQYCKLGFKGNYDYSEWSDLVKGVVVFASRESAICDISGDQHPKSGSNMEWYNGIYSNRVIVANTSQYRKLSESTEEGTAQYFLPLNSFDERDILSDLKSSAVFYKLFNAGLSGSDNFAMANDYIDTHVLENLETQDQLGTIDFFNHCQLVPEIISSYNSRLLLGNVKRGFFPGFSQFLPYHNSNEHEIDAYVYIRTDSGERVVHNSYSTYEKQGYYFYYPDPRAYLVTIFVDGVEWRTMDLKEHPLLNGAYYFDALPSEDNEQTFEESSQSENAPDVNMTPELLESRLYVSEVNNPFAFYSRGVKTVGGGRIVGLALLTTSLSQGQFGQFPVIVFTNEGIWTMQVNGEGYLEPAQPMSRDVCINANGILETDGAVFFVSKKGLMLIVGNSTGNISVKCVTEQMKGAAFNTYSIGTGDPIGTDTDWEIIIRDCADSRGFLEYIRDESCFLAYDYIEGRILIINPSYWYCYVFNMKDESVSKLMLSEVFTGAVKSYPDYLLQGNSSRKVFSLYSAKDETEVIGRHLAFLMTRPMKLSGPTGVSSLRELANVGYWDKANGSVVKTEVYVSDNLFNWYKVESRFGAAAKYYRIALFIKMKMTERLSGTIIREQERRSDNVRM